MLPQLEKKSAFALSEFFWGLVVVEIDRHSQIFSLLLITTSFEWHLVKQLEISFLVANYIKLYQ